MRRRRLSAVRLRLRARFIGDKWFRRAMLEEERNKAAMYETRQDSLEETLRLLTERLTQLEKKEVKQ